MTGKLCVINLHTFPLRLISFQYENASTTGNDEIPIERCSCPRGHRGLSCQVRKLMFQCIQVIVPLVYTRNVWMVISCLHLVCAYRVNVMDTLLTVIPPLGNVKYVLPTVKHDGSFNGFLQNCQNNMMGFNCEQCLPCYIDIISGSSFVCEACNCSLTGCR